MPHRFPAARAAVSVLLLTLLGPTRAQAPLPAAPAHGLDLSGLDTRVKPCDDFYQFANGGWLAHALIPADYPGVGTGRDVYDRDQAALHTLCERAAADTHAAPGSPAGKVGAFYRSGMDTARLEARGAAPLAPEFARIAGVKDVPSLLAEIGRLHRSGVLAAFAPGVEQDPGASAQQIAALGQGGLSLPERGYYLRTDKETQATRDAFVAHAAKTFVLLGDAPGVADRAAQTVLAIETQLAQASKDPVDLRDPHANYHPLTLEGQDALTPGVSWRPYFDAVGLRGSVGRIDVGQPAFFTALGRMLSQTPLADWQSYLRFQLVDAEATRLSHAFQDEHFHFYGTVLAGVTQQPPRWKRIVAATDASLGEALGQLYVAQNFPPAAKARALALVQNLKAVLRDRLQTLPWMTPATKTQALVKLDAMRIKIGYPDKWRDYTILDVSSPDYVVNVMRAQEFEFQRQLNKIGKPVDEGEWAMSPPTVDAYYNPQTNDINFPAGILQPPFFDPQADDAVNYGAIGSVIGHEMTHGFDDQGRQFDSQGNLRDWWTAEDAKNFTQRAQGVVAQYSAYEPLPGAHINGALTQGENIADIGGLKIAYLALEKALAGKPRTLIDGYTPEQRFFLSFARNWRDKNRAEVDKIQMLSDPHSPARFRVIGPLADMPEFRQAWGCAPDPKASPTAIW